MVFIGYGLLGLMAGGFSGLIGGFLLVQILTVIAPADCREGACGIAAIILMFYGLLIGAGGGFLIGLWRAWRLHRRTAAPSS